MNFKELAEVSKWTETTDLEEIVFKDKTKNFSIKNGSSNICNFKLESNLLNVNSSFVGIFRFSLPGKTMKLLKNGDMVKKGQVLGYVEVLKDYKEVLSPIDGTIKTFCFKEGDCVDYDSPILFIEKPFI